MLLILKAFWPWILGAVLIASGLAYLKVLHLEIAHFKADAQKYEQLYTDYRNNNEQMQAALKSSNAAITLKFKEALVASNAAAEESRKSLNQRIQGNASFHSVNIPGAAVRLFNDSTAEPHHNVLTGTEPTDAGQASPATASPVTSPDVDLTTLLQVSADNNIEHWKCVHQVEAWQNFWSDYKQKTLSIQPGDPS